MWTIGVCKARPGNKRWPIRLQMWAAGSATVQLQQVYQSAMAQTCASRVTAPASRSLPPTPHTPNSTPQTPHSTLRTPHLHTYSQIPNSKLHNAPLRPTLHTPHSTLHTPHSPHPQPTCFIAQPPHTLSPCHPVTLSPCHPVPCCATPQVSPPADKACAGMCPGQLGLGGHV